MSFAFAKAYSAIYSTMGYTPGTEAPPPTRPAGTALVDRDTPRTNADNCILQFVNSFFSSSSAPFSRSIQLLCSPWCSGPSHENWLPTAISFILFFLNQENIINRNDKIFTYIIMAYFLIMTYFPITLLNLSLSCNWELKLNSICF